MPAMQVPTEWLSILPYESDELARELPDLLRCGELASIKVEAMDRDKNVYEVDFSVRSDKGGMTPMFFLYDRRSDSLHSPAGCLDGPANSAARRRLIPAIRQSLESPDIRLNEAISGCIYDPALRDSIQRQYQMYMWERTAPGTVFAPLRGYGVQMARYAYAAGLLPDGATVVDGACGLGCGARYLSKTCPRVYAVDLSTEALQLGMPYYDSPRIAWLTADIAALPLLDNTADGFICMEALEHVPDPVAMLREIRRVTRPGGVAVVSTPNGQSPHRQRVKNPYHVKEYWLGELQEMVDGIFQSVEWKGIDPGGRLQPAGPANVTDLVGFVMVLR